ncbi:hypothetical protein FQN50_003893 [Emmonsiellopsis sp. PD_5]|nr:hypothetical protein FQN50_003893 [Emmonsiellopsis sp. PD_5]
MGTEGDPAVAVAGQGEVTVEYLSEEEEEEVDIESLKAGTLKVAAKVAEGLGGLDTSTTLEYLASGAYNHVWLLTYLPKTATDTSYASEQVKKLVLRVPKELADSLHPYQLRHEVACLQFLAHNLPDIPAPRVLLWDDRAPQPFIAQEFIDGHRLSSVWPQLTEDQKASITRSIANVVARLGETRFDFIGGLDPDAPAGPTIEGGKVFCGKAKFHSHDCYNIGPYIDSKDYILSCYDREIYYHSHADEKDIVMEVFEKVTVAEFVEFLKLEKEKVSRDVQLFQALDAEPRVLVHEDFHAGNMLARDGRLVGVVDWEFSGVYPLSELLGASQPIQVSESGRDGATEAEEDEWDRRYRQELEKIVRQRGWTEENIKTLLGGGWSALQRVSTVMFPDDSSNLLEGSSFSLSPQAKENLKFEKSMSSLLQLGRRILSRRKPSLPRCFSVTSPVIDSSIAFEEETLPFYEHEQYYPARLGEVFNTRYQLVGKLGYGAYSTVWLCRDLIEHKYAALKISTQLKKFPKKGRAELNIYEHLSELNSTHPGQGYIRELHDTFEIQGPLSSHQCLALQPMHMSLHDLIQKYRPLDVSMLREVLKRLLNVLDFLHTEAHIIHTDLKADNLMFSIDDNSMLESFEKSELEDPSPRKIIDDTREIYRSRSLGMPKNNAWGDLALCDFGEARIGQVQQDTGPFIQPHIYRAPEVTFEIPWGASVDIWNVGTLIWDLFEGRHLFGNIMDEQGHYDPFKHMAQVVALLGPPPKELMLRSETIGQCFDADGNWQAGNHEKIPDISFEDLETRLAGNDKVLFLKFIRSMLSWLPEDRRTARELLDDPWLNEEESSV